jgi:hypothetical protein
VHSFEGEDIFQEICKLYNLLIKFEIFRITIKKASRNQSTLYLNYAHHSDFSSSRVRHLFEKDKIYLIQMFY